VPASFGNLQPEYKAAHNDDFRRVDFNIGHLVLAFRREKL